MEERSIGMACCIAGLLSILISFISVLIAEHKISDYTNYIIVVGDRDYRVNDYTINGDILEFDDYYFGSTYHNDGMTIQGNYSIIPSK
jgi:hypothetical protein